MQTIARNSQANAYLNVFRRWWWLPVLLAVLSAGLTYAGTKALIKPQYGATIQLQIQPTDVGATNNQVVDANAAATLMTSGTVLNLAAHHLTGVAATDTGALYRTSCIADSADRFVSCSTTSRNYLVPAMVLNTLAHTFIPWNRQRLRSVFQGDISGYSNHINQLNKEIARLKNQLKTVSPSSLQYSFITNQILQDKSSLQSFFSQRQQAYSSITADAGSVTVTSPPAAKDVPVSPHPARNAFLGAIVGIGIAAALIVLLEYLDDSFRSSDEVAEATGLSILGAVRRYEESGEEMGMVAAKKPRTAMAEAYRVARANIQFTNVSGTLRVLVITSARDGEGKTTTANNLATTFALAGQRVLLVDADLRRPGLTKMLHLKDVAGLSSVLVEPGTAVIQTTEVAGLSVVPSGPIPPNPAELLGSQRMRDWVEEAAKRYDLVILDSPPVLSVADTRILATVADGVVMVLDPSLTTRRMIKQAALAIENVGSRVLGLILNRDTMRGEGYYYNYYYYYGSKGEGEAERAPAR